MEDEKDIKKAIGQRFKQFRLELKKTQGDLALELQVYQSTVTNIEVGKTFPGIKYLKNLQDRYGLNLNWLINGLESIFFPHWKKTKKYKSYLFTMIDSSDPRLDKYQELIDLMVIPEIEEIIFGKLTEIKLVAKELIEDFKRKSSDEDLEPTAE